MKNHCTECKVYRCYDVIGDCKFYIEGVDGNCVFRISATCANSDAIEEASSDAKKNG